MYRIFDGDPVSPLPARGEADPIGDQRATSGKRHESLEKFPGRYYCGSVERLFPDISCDGLHGALLGLGARQFGGCSALSAVGQEFRNAGNDRRRGGSRNFVFIKDLPDFAENPPFAFTACHGHNRLLCRVQKRRQIPFQEHPPLFQARNMDSRRTGSNHLFVRRFSVPA